MEENLLGQLLKANDPATAREVERRLAADPAVAHDLARLRAALAPLEADRAAGLVLAGLAEHLDEGGLEDVVGQVRVAQVAAQIAVQLPLVAADQGAEHVALAAAEPGEEVLVGQPV